ncbi:MAG: sugar nucleotide-binding protein [Bacteroidota bacterium]
MCSVMVSTPATKMMLLGATSMLGYNLAKAFPGEVLPYIPWPSRAPAVKNWPVMQLDSEVWIEALAAGHPHQTFLYCHAVCDITKCEENPDWAYEINVEHVKRLIKALPAETRLVYVSSDHVFGGRDALYDEESAPAPISVYGRTRVAAEELVLARADSLVVRAGLAIGDSPDGRTGHRDWLRYRSQRNLPITIIEDEFRSTVWAHDLARRLMDLANSTVTGIRHVPATRVISRVRLANYLIGELGIAASYTVKRRSEKEVPHLGHVGLSSIFDDALSTPLPSVVAIAEN